MPAAAALHLILSSLDDGAWGQGPGTREASGSISHIWPFHPDSILTGLAAQMSPPPAPSGLLGPLLAQPGSALCAGNHAGAPAEPI